MRRALAPLLASVLLACGPVDPAAAAARVPEIPFELERGRTILLLRVGESRPLRFILDTGMAFDGALVYNPDLADSIALPDPIEVKVPGAGSGEPASGRMTEHGSFGSGEWRADSQRVIVLQDDAMAGMPTDGVLGWSLLGHHALELDYDASVMRLHEPGYAPPDSGWVKVGLFFRGNLIPWVTGTLSTRGDTAVEVAAYIDYASGEAIELMMKPGQKFQLPEGLEASYLGTGLSGDIHGYKGRIAWFELAGFRFDGVAASFAADEVRSKQDRADVVLGCGLLSRFNTIFDYSDTAAAVMWVRPNRRFDGPF